MPGGGLSAGKAYKHLESLIPKGAKIIEKGSLSTDSFNNVLKRAADAKRFGWTNEGYTKLNTAGRNLKLTNNDKSINGSLSLKFEDFKEARKAVEELNSRIKIKDMPKARVSKEVDEVQLVTDGPFIKKTTFGVEVPNIGLIKNYKQGGVIKDDMGQWAHPGEVTEIGSNRITMKGVDYPVIGVSDTGDTRLMYPGEEHQFKGKKVTEFPMGKSGAKLKLTNFTDYNTAPSGGWLDTL